MSPFSIDPAWYEKAWYAPRPVAPRQPRSRIAICLAVAVLLTFGGSVAAAIRGGHEDQAAQLVAHHPPGRLHRF